MITETTKQEAVKALNQGETYDTVAKRYKVSASSLALWRKKFNTASAQTPIQTLQRDTSHMLLALREENTRLKLKIADLYLQAGN